MTSPKTPHVNATPVTPATDVEETSHLASEETSKVAEPTEFKQVLDKVSAILAEYGQRESDVPLGHEYWALNARMRQLRSEGKDKV
jgi:hypothetical protein